MVSSPRMARRPAYPAARSASAARPPAWPAPMMTRLPPRLMLPLLSCDLDVDRAALDLHRIGLEVGIGGRVEHLAVGDVEPRLMHGAFDGAALEIAIRQADIG